MVKKPLPPATWDVALLGEFVRSLPKYPNVTVFYGAYGDWAATPQTTMGFIHALQAQGIRVGLYPTSLRTTASIDDLMPIVRAVGHLGVSLDGDAAVSRRQRGNSWEHHSTATRMLAMARAEGIEPYVHITVASDTPVLKSYQYLSNIGMVQGRLAVPYPSMTDPKYQSLSDNIGELLTFLCDGRDREVSHLLSHMSSGDFFLRLLVAHLFRMEAEVHCPAGTRSIFVDPDGVITPCAYLDKGQYTIQNLSGSTDEDVAASTLAAMDSLAAPSRCLSCRHRGICGGPCPAQEQRRDPEDSYCSIIDLIGSRLPEIVSRIDQRTFNALGSAYADLALPVDQPVLRRRAASGG